MLWETFDVVPDAIFLLISFRSPLSSQKLPHFTFACSKSLLPIACEQYGLHSTQPIYDAKLSSSHNHCTPFFLDIATNSKRPRIFRVLSVWRTFSAASNAPAYMREAIFCNVGVWCGGVFQCAPFSL